MTTRIPNPVSLEKSIRMYYSRLTLSVGDIRELFACGYSKAERLKKMAADYMIAHSIRFMDASKVNTAPAYMAWGLDINDLEMRYNKLKELDKVG